MIKNKTNSLFMASLSVMLFASSVSRANEQKLAPACLSSQFLLVVDYARGDGPPVPDSTHPTLQECVARADEIVGPKKTLIGFKPYMKCLGNEGDNFSVVFTKFRNGTYAHRPYISTSRYFRPTPYCEAKAQ